MRHATVPSIACAELFRGRLGSEEDKGGVASLLCDHACAHIHHQAKDTAIGIAVVAFYLLDFSLNALQASLRNLLLDVTPPEQLSAGNAWHGRMTHAGNILGFGCGECQCLSKGAECLHYDFAGFLNLAGWPVLRALGGSQFRKFCVVGIVILVITVWTTCWTQDEVQRKSHSKEQRSAYWLLYRRCIFFLYNLRDSGTREVLGNIYNAILHLPKPIRKVCFVQLFAFMAWCVVVGVDLAHCAHPSSC